MKIITINLPERYYFALEILKDLQVIPSRSEAIRLALKEFLEKEHHLFNDLDPNMLKMTIRGSLRK